MSRSRKKTPCCHVVKRDRSAKKRFNRRIRRCRLEESVSGDAGYKRLNDSFDIDEWKIVDATYGDYAASYAGRRRADNAKRRNDYERAYLRK